jgi:CheY-like chemotaxis protein
MPPTALIVDDEPEANKLLASLIQFRGYRTISALTGAEALAAVARELPDVVFLDLMLPDFPGYDVCRQLKSQSETALIPVVMVTARVARENRLQSFRVGADEYVSKPYTPDQIFDALDAASGWTGPDGRPPVDGEIPFNSDSGGETLRDLARMRNLLLATTPLDAVAVGLMFGALESLWESASAWGCKHGVACVAGMNYHVYAHSAVLTLTDFSNWLQDDPGSALKRWSRALLTEAFDEIEDEGDGKPLVLTKRFPESSTS